MHLYLRPVIVRVIDTLEPRRSPSRIVEQWGAHAYQLLRGQWLLDSRSTRPASPYRVALAEAEQKAAALNAAWATDPCVA